MAGSGVKVATTEELHPGDMKAVVVDGHRILLLRIDDGYYAIDEMCSHEEESLAGGYVEGMEIECPRHGSIFDIATGAVKSLPAVMPIGTHLVVVEGNDIFVSLGTQPT